MKLVYPKGSTSRIATVFIQDSSATDGSGLGSLDESSSIVGGFVREGSTGVALAVDEDVTTEGTYQAPSAAGKVRIGTPANMRTGTYELHFHNDLFATGAESVVVTLGGATNMAPLTLEIQLSDLETNIVNIKSAVSPYPETIIASGSGTSLTLASDPGADFTTGYAVIFDVSASRQPRIIETVSKVGTTLTLVNSVSITIENGVDTVLLVPLPSSPFVAADFDSGVFPPNFPVLGINASGHLSRVTLTDTTTTNTDQRGTDNAALATALSALQSSVDGLAVGVATRCRIATAAAFEHPESGSIDYSIQILTVDDLGVPVAADSTPTVTITNVAGTDRSANLSAISNPSTGRYTATYTVTNGDTLEPLILSATATIGGESHVAVSLPVVTDAVSVDFTATDRNNLLAALADTNEMQQDWVDGGRLDLILDAALAIGNANSADLNTAAQVRALMSATVTDTNNLAFAIKAVTDLLPDSGALTSLINLLTAIQTEVGKIPRAATEKTAGGQITRTKVSADGSTLVETLS